MTEPPNTIVVVGSGHLAAVISAMWLGWGHRVRLLVPDGGSALLRGELPADEADLLNFLADRRRAGRLSIGATSGTDMSGATLLHLAEDVTVLRDGRREPGQAEQLMDVFATLYRACTPAVTVIVSSQFPVGTSDALVARLATGRPPPGVVCWPENFQIGRGFSAVQTMSRVMLGTSSARAYAAVRTHVPATVELRLVGSCVDAEFYKHSLNFLLALMMSYGTVLGRLGSRVGADADKVLRAVRLDSRVSATAPILPGPPLNAPTVLRDLATVSELSTAGTDDLAGFLLTMCRKARDDLLCTLVDVAGRNGSALVVGVGYKREAHFRHHSLGTELLDALQSSSARVTAFHPGFDRYNCDRWPAVRWLAGLEQVDDDCALIIAVLPELLATVPERLRHVPVIDPADPRGLGAGR